MSQNNKPSDKQNSWQKPNQQGGKNAARPANEVENPNRRSERHYQGPESEK